MPIGWLVHASAGEVVVSHPRGMAAAMVRARTLPPATDLASWLGAHYVATEPGLHNVRLHRVQALGPLLALAGFDYGSPVLEGRASVVAARREDSATVVVAAAARGEFAAQLPQLARILHSLQGSERLATARDLSRLLRSETGDACEAPTDRRDHTTTPAVRGQKGKP